MPLMEVGAIALALLGVVIFGHLWFHLVESVLAWIRRRFIHPKTPPAWHPLIPQEEDTHHEGSASKPQTGEERQGSRL
jgi:hypothetical protein